MPPQTAWVNHPALAAAPVDEQTERIRQLLRAGRSLNAIQDEVFGYRGGAAYAAVSAVKRAMTGDTAASDTGPVSLAKRYVTK